VAPAGLFATPASDADVRFWPKADVQRLSLNVRFRG